MILVVSVYAVSKSPQPIAATVRTRCTCFGTMKAWRGIDQARIASSGSPASSCCPSAAAARALPSDPVTWLWHSAKMLREHRGHGHVGARIGGTEAHALEALAQGIHPPQSCGRGVAPQEARSATCDFTAHDGWPADSGEVEPTW